MSEPFIFFEKEIEMDTNNLFSGINVKRDVTPEQMNIKDSVPQELPVYNFDNIRVNTGEPIYETPQYSEAEKVPIFKLQAVEEARELTKKFKDDANYEELVKYVQKWKTFMSGENDTEMDHRALAVLLDDQIMFEELKRSHQELDDLYEYLAHEPNGWEKHCEMYDKLLEDIKVESAKCDEAQKMLDRLFMRV